jgi:hypothetical protein
MFDRHWFGDLSLAVLIALPLVALARLESAPPKSIFAPSATVSQTDRVPGNGRISLLG